MNKELPRPARNLLYRQIAAVLRGEITRDYHPGAAIATESELEARFGVSRITIRRAIEELVQAGLLLRRQGSGTFVARPKVTQDLGVVRSWTESMRAQGLEPCTVDCQMMLVVPPTWVAQALRLHDQQPDPVLHISRLRYANGEPLCLMVDYIRARFVPGLAERGLDGESLYATLQQRYHLDLTRVEDTIVAQGACFVDAKLLDIAPGDPVLNVIRVTYLPGDEPLAAAAVTARGDRYQYRITGQPV